jgi:predicted alpha/beta hydrolase
MEAGPTLFLDNVNSIALKSDVLASAITERPAAVRPLGRSATVQLNPTAFVAVTGNGLLLSEDMARRSVTVELDAGIEDPETRDFRGNFLSETLAAREALLADALTIWRWGRQMGDALPAGRSLGSFNDWARWCRDPLVALGCHDPALRVADAKAKDPRRQRVAELFTA